MLFKKLSLKMFCVGDALQMINPAYFSFGYLKNLMYEKDATDVKTLSHNYRNSAKIEEIIDALADINKAEFGTHNFVVKGESVDSGVRTEAVFVSDANFINKVAREKFDNFTFVVASDEEKKKLKKTIKNQEVLTVSEIKGLERPTVIVYNILSSNRDKWDYLDRVKVAHKQADENSVFRYYYNLFYVGVSRAKQNIFVVEDYSIKQFVRFFQNNFVSKDHRGALSLLEQVVGKVDITQEEILSRVLEFVKAEQYDNARFIANKIQDNDKKINEDNNWTPWIRVASPMASDGAGFFFTPAEGDEVIIDFENENIESPYVNGAFYNDSNKPGAAAQTQTHGKVKSISSANGHHISFTDNGGLERYMANFLPLSKYIIKISILISAG
jgi:hypothetical protein